MSSYVRVWLAGAGCHTQWCHLHIILFAPSPTQPHCSCAAEVPGIERRTALNDIFAVIPHTVTSLLSPTITTQYIKNMSKACCWIQSLHLPQILIHHKIKCHQSLFIHQRRVISKMFYIHLSLLMANPNASHEPFIMWPHSSTDLILICNPQGLSEVKSGECSLVPVLLLQLVWVWRPLELHPKLYPPALPVSSAIPVSVPDPPGKL